MTRQLRGKTEDQKTFLHLPGIELVLWTPHSGRSQQHGNSVEMLSADHINSLHGSFVDQYLLYNDVSDVSGDCFCRNTKFGRLQPGTAVCTTDIVKSSIFNTIQFIKNSLLNFLHFAVYISTMHSCPISTKAFMISLSNTEFLHGLEFEFRDEEKNFSWPHCFLVITSFIPWPLVTLLSKRRYN